MKNVIRTIILLGAVACVFTSCYQAASNGDDDLSTTPVTNNPLIIPNQGSAMPGMGSSFPQ
jgi:hypothetical protein